MARVGASWRTGASVPRPGVNRKIISSRMPPEPNSTRPLEERLESWKEIAAYLKKGVRTVQRWEQSEGLPVRRLGQDRTGFVFAYKSELDAWWQEQSRRAHPEPAPALEPAVRPVRWRTPLILAAAVAAVVGGVLWTARSGDRPPYRLVPLTSEHGSEFNPSFSPDGQQIAYVWVPPGGRPSIYKKAVGPESGVRLTAGTDPEGSPAWSPDGRLIAFVRSTQPNRGFRLMLIPASGGPESEVAQLASGRGLSWSADSKWLIASDGPSKARSIVAILVATGAKHALTKPYEFDYRHAALSSDLHRLVYAHSGPGPADVYEQTLGPDLAPRGEPRLLLANLWSSEMLIDADKREAISIDNDWESVLFRQRLAPGAKPQILYRGYDSYSSVAVSRDGRRLAFGVVRSRVNTWKLPLGNSAGAPAPLLSSTHSDMNPDYSPDGRHIAFHSTRSGGSDIWITDSDGANPRRLTFTNARTTATPRWSPDGEWIAFESNVSGQHEVYLVRSAGGPIQRLTENPAIDAIPSWSRDGRTLYFCSDRTGRFEVWKMPPSGGKPTQVTFDGGFSAVESPDAKYLYYSQTRNFGPVMRMPLAGGAAEAVIPEVRGLFYAVTASGIYFQVTRTISFWDAASGKVRDIFTSLKPMGIGMAASPDGRALLFTQVETEGSDLYMIDGLR
jgi:Tol biopolymer transport system component